ncbi:hypothetical protein [Aphanothece sacrum]|uniref:Penicillin binding protein n=1 Tax=Aphanothece sacrum FPU1 TaxID=1920663 RepID=A0A401ICW3_APHSA|nr:hypothetical protein [Aphanothece sacrum]GBF79081.1 penicillin binding protein [Aphanothece sacrum FPU1]GBF85127.1 penicillin-binding protein [Aphanothece sacrum FPU3]
MNNNSEQERILRAKKQAKKVFLILLGFGLFLGVVVSIGVIQLMNKLGLTEKNNQTEIFKQKVE